MKEGRRRRERLMGKCSPGYSTTRIAALKDCLTRYVNADEIVNVKAVIRAFEDKVLGNYMDQWTVFYNGKIVDRINSYHELLWSVRDPLYKEVYGPKGSIWIEPVSRFSLFKLVLAHS